MSRSAGAVGGLSLLLLLSCTTVPAAPPRPKSPLPQSISKRFQKPSELFQAKVEETHDGASFTQQKGRFRAGDQEAVPFEIFLPAGAERSAFVLVLPYLDGSYLLPRLLCKRLARSGIAAGFLERPGDVLSPEQSASDIESLIQNSVRRYRGFLDWVGQNPQIDPDRLGAVGISMGGIVGTVLLAAEPRLSRAVLILPGADLASILPRSSEIKVRTYLEARRREESITTQQIQEEFRKDLLSDPAELAAYVDPRGILFISARFDTVIPRENSDLLWDRLGKPERVFLPTGHGSAGFCYPYIAARMTRHFQGWEAERPARIANQSPTIRLPE